MRSSGANKTRHKGGGHPPTPPPVPNYTLTVAGLGAGNGTITGPGINSGTGDLTQSYPAGTSVTLTASPDASSDFGAWSGGVTSTATPVTFTINGNMTVNATFTVVTGTGGSGSDDTGVAAIDSHMGAIKKDDRLTQVDPCPNLWIKSTSPYTDGPYTTAKPQSGDTWIVRNTTGGDPHIARGQTTASAAWRRIKSDQTVQDVYDASKPGNDSTRTQLVNNSTTNTFWPGVEGGRYWYMFSHRSHGAGLPHAIASNQGVQVCQWKCPVSVGGTTQPILAIGQYSDGYQVVYHDWNTGAKHYYPMSFSTQNTWVRFWVDIKWSATPANASFSVWWDAGGGAPTHVVPLVTGLRTLFVSSGSSNWSHGIYASPATDLGGILNSDYANLQVCNYIT